MKTKFMIGGSKVRIFKMNEDTALDQLPAMIYTVKFNKFEGFFLEMIKDHLELPSKIYGKTPQRVEKCVKTYIDRNSSTGVLLTGDKGTGKTLLVSLLANTVIDQLNLPVILIQDPFSGSEFTSFIDSIGECCIIFDEFGKMYAARGNSDGPTQNDLLSLMDGLDKTKRLILLTENSELDINEFILNRPSRIYYHFKYRKLDEDSIVGYCQDHGINYDTINEILEISRRSRIFSFDMLKSIVEEHNRYGGSIKDIIDDLNIDISEDNRNLMEIIKIVDRQTNEEVKIQSDSMILPRVDNRHRYGYIKVIDNSKNRDQVKPIEENDDYYEICIENDNLVYEKNGKRVYETDDYVIVAHDIQPSLTNYSLLV